MQSGFQAEDDFLEDDWDFDYDDSEIDGDCNESQPCRGDEPWLDQDLLELRGLGTMRQTFRIAQVE
jgi:hypothetical protein